jgi:hypothetical protein
MPSLSRRAPGALEPTRTLQAERELADVPVLLLTAPGAPFRERLPEPAP